MDVNRELYGSFALYKTSDVSYIQAGLKSTVSVAELISSNQLRAQEVTVQRSRISNTVLSYILEENSEKLPDIELFH